MEKKHFADVAKLVIDSNRGIYIGQEFAKQIQSQFGFDVLSGISKDVFDILLQGPDHEEYSELWNDITFYRDMLFTDQTGVEWMFQETNEGLFMYPKSDNDLIDWDEIS